MASKEQQRNELHATIWNAANYLVHGGGLTPVQFMDYMLGGLFYRFISENLAQYLNKKTRQAGVADFKYEELSDEIAERAREATVAEKGFYLLPSELFCNVCKNAKTDDNLNMTLESVFRNFENSAKGTNSEDSVDGLFDNFDVNSKFLGDTVPKRNELLARLLNTINELPMGDYEDQVIDTFGDAYEYLIFMYASNSGKKGGEFYTPQEVSELLTKIVLHGKTEVNKVYDPCCGSGSLLLNFAKILGKDKVRQGFYGQEIVHTTYNLCRMNMFLHNINYDKFHIAKGDTLKEPKHWDDEPFDAIVSNPPYSVPWEGKNNPLLINDPRFSPAGVLAPNSKADLAFTMHMLSWLATNGTAAIVEFPGILYRSGVEQKIRKYLIDNNFVDTVIQLPDNLFFGTPIATCILVLKKSKSDNSVLFIDATEHYEHEGNKNKLTSDNIQSIYKAYVERVNKPFFCRLVKSCEIEEQNYTISVSTYVKKSNTSAEIIDIDILNAQIDEIVKKQTKLRNSIEAIIKTL